MQIEVLLTFIFPPPGTDINGDGVPDVIVGFSRSAHRCSEHAYFTARNASDVLNGNIPIQFKIWYVESKQLVETEPSL